MFKRLATSNVYALVACGVAVFMSASSASAQSHGFVETALEVGLTPEALVVAEFTLDEAQTVLTHLLESSDERAALDALHGQIDQEIGTISQLRQQLADDPENAELRQQLQTSESALDGLRVSLEAQQVALFDIALYGCTTNQREFATAFAGSQGYRISPEYRIRERSAEQWMKLERALRAEARATRRGEDLDLEYSNFLVDVRSDPEVHYARIRLEQGLAAMKVLFGAE